RPRGATSPRSSLPGLVQSDLLAGGVVHVEATPGLASEEARRDVVPEERRGPVFVVAQIALEDLGDGEQRIEADEVGELERPERVIETEPGALVDVLGGADALLEGEAGLVQEGDEHPVHEKAWAILTHDGDLAESFGEAPTELERGGARRKPSNELDELHHRDGIHEVHAEHALRPARGRRETGDGDARGVGRQDGVLGGEPVGPGEQLELQLEVFGRCLDHHVGAAQGLVHFPGLDAGEQRVARRLFELSLLNEAVEHGAELVSPGTGSFDTHVGEEDGNPLRGRDLRNPGAHLSGAEHCERSDACGLHAGFSYPPSRCLARRRPGSCPDAPPRAKVRPRMVGIALLLAGVLALATAGCDRSRPGPMSQAVRLADKGRSAEALRLIEEHLAEHPDAVAERRLAVRLAGATGDLGRASTHASALERRLGPTSPVPLLELGHAFELAHRYDEALLAYDRAGVVAPNDAAGPRTGGFRAAAWGELELAEPRLSEAVRRNPNDGRAWHALGVVRARLGRLDAAEAAYTSGLSVDPDGVDNRIGLATVSLLRDDPRGLLREYDALLARHPEV